MSQEEPKEIKKEKLPWFYRLILKMPGADFLEGMSSGIFWAIVVPVFLILELLLNMLCLVWFPFPINIVTAAIGPACVFLMFVRINLQRFLNLWNSTIPKSGNEWNVEKRVQEYLASLKKKSK